MINKKEQGLSLNTIIIAIIVLVVLVVLIMVFTGVLGNFTEGASECKNKGGFCKDGKTDRSCGTNIFGKDIPRLSQYDFSCKAPDGSNDDQRICCLDIGKKDTSPPSSNGRNTQAGDIGSRCEDSPCKANLRCIEEPEDPAIVPPVLVRKCRLPI